VQIRPGNSHVWAYLSPAGGFAVDPVMGSHATHLRSAIGPLGARMLAAGQALPLRPQGRLADQPERLAHGGPRPVGGILRFVPGPQADAFTDAAMARFCRAPYTLSPHSDRMGYRLEGEKLAHAHGHDIVSDGIAFGAIQVPGDGLPIVLMADRQPTGGYPKIGTVIRADLPRLAQCRAGDTVRFRAVSTDEAVLALRHCLDAAI
jgi:5-oxoprolinase (ATP-hydrolysing) subunit C